MVGRPRSNTFFLSNWSKRWTWPKRDPPTYDGRGHALEARFRRMGMEFFLELLVNGLLVGMMYALVALSFVLIYKATSVINFAQGELVMFGGFIAAAMLTRYGLPLTMALPVAPGLMISF